MLISICHSTVVSRTVVNLLTVQVWLAIYGYKQWRAGWLREGVKMACFGALWGTVFEVKLLA